MNYIPTVSDSFLSINKILREVSNGYIIKYIHFNGSMFLFLFLNLHIFRGLFYNSYTLTISWILGVILYFFMLFIAFLGYSLPYGQMSYWGATVITNFISVIPFIGEDIKLYIWGDTNIGSYTLNRFYVLHYLLPFILIFIILLHIYSIHIKGRFYSYWFER